MKKMLRKIDEDAWIVWVGSLYFLPFALISYAVEGRAYKYVPWHYQAIGWDFVGSLTCCAISLCFLIAGTIVVIKKWEN